MSESPTSGQPNQDAGVGEPKALAVPKSPLPPTPAPVQAVMPTVETESETHAAGWRWWDKQAPDGESYLSKLEAAFAFGCTDDEACLYAGITYRQLRYYQETISPEFMARKRMLKERPVLLARQTVINNLAKNPELAFRFLERRRRDEFAPSVNVNTGDSEKLADAIKLLAAITKNDDAPVKSLEGGDDVQGQQSAVGDSAALPAIVRPDSDAKPAAK